MTGRGGCLQRDRWAGDRERGMIHVGGRPRSRNFAGIQGGSIERPRSRNFAGIQGGSIGAGIRFAGIIEGRGTPSGEFVESGGTRGRLRFAVERGRRVFLLLDRGGV